MRGRFQRREKAGGMSMGGCGGDKVGGMRGRWGRREGYGKAEVKKSLRGRRRKRGRGWGWGGGLRMGGGVEDGGGG
jgi:hypothetical protein